jgi:hypothetical protein
VLAGQAGIGVLAGSSVKATLDLDWDTPTARDQALGVVLEALVQVEQLAGVLAGGMAHRSPTPWPRPGRSATRT